MSDFKVKPNLPGRTGPEKDGEVKYNVVKGGRKSWNL